MTLGTEVWREQVRELKGAPGVQSSQVGRGRSLDTGPPFPEAAKAKGNFNLTFENCDHDDMPQAAGFSFKPPGGNPAPSARGHRDWRPLLNCVRAGFLFIRPVRTVPC